MISRVKVVQQQQMHNFWVKAVPQQKTAHLLWKTVHPPICDGKHYETNTDWTLYVNADTDSDSLSLHTRLYLSMAN